MSQEIGLMDRGTDKGDRGRRRGREGRRRMWKWKRERRGGEGTVLTFWSEIRLPMMMYSCLPTGATGGQASVSRWPGADRDRDRGHWQGTQSAGGASSVRRTRSTLERPPPRMGIQPPVLSSRRMTWALTRARIAVLVLPVAGPKGWPPEIGTAAGTGVGAAAGGSPGSPAPLGSPWLIVVCVRGSGRVGTGVTGSGAGGGGQGQGRREGGETRWGLRPETADRGRQAGPRRAGSGRPDVE